MRHFVHGLAMLQLLAFASLSWVQEEIRFVLAGAAILCLLEIGLALRARRSNPGTAGAPLRISAVHVSCAEQDGAAMVTLAGEPRAAGRTPCVLLSRSLRPESQCMEPCLELPDQRAAIRGGIREAYLSPQQLHLTLDARGAEALGSSSICIDLQAATEQRRLERALSKILRGIPFTSERSIPEEAMERPSTVAQ